METVKKLNEDGTLKTTRTDIPSVDPRNIVIEEGFNVRKDMGDIEGLARSVVEMGVIVPIEGFKVRGEDKYVLTDGHRRFAAVTLALKHHAEGKAGFEDISKIQMLEVHPGSSNMKERLYTMAITGEKKKDLTELERADMYSRLLEYAVGEGKKKGEAVKEICKRVGISQATFYNIVKLNELPEVVKASIERGEITGSTFVSIVRDVKDEQTQIKMVNEAIEDAKSVAVTEGKGVKKATAKNVKGGKAKTPMQKLKAVQEKMVHDGLINSRTKFLNFLIEALENGDSTNDIYELLK
ncbi:MAG: ParB N-terminal domain-containing protein [Bacteroidia bacterium]|nr:ParB N-terminal domain-containing protein [Bacteroidia bacterium]